MQYMMEIIFFVLWIILSSFMVLIAVLNYSVLLYLFLYLKQHKVYSVHII